MCEVLDRGFLEPSDNNLVQKSADGTIELIKISVPRPTTHQEYMRAGVRCPSSLAIESRAASWEALSETVERNKRVLLGMSLQTSSAKRDLTNNESSWELDLPLDLVESHDYEALNTSQKRPQDYRSILVAIRFVLSFRYEKEYNNLDRLRAGSVIVHTNNTDDGSPIRLEAECSSGTECFLNSKQKVFLFVDGLDEPQPCWLPLPESTKFQSLLTHESSYGKGCSWPESYQGKIRPDLHNAQTMQDSHASIGSSVDIFLQIISYSVLRPQRLSIVHDGFENNERHGPFTDIITSLHGAMLWLRSDSWFPRPILPGKSVFHPKRSGDSSGLGSKGSFKKFQAQDGQVNHSWTSAAWVLRNIGLGGMVISTYKLGKLQSSVAFQDVGKRMEILKSHILPWTFLWFTAATCTYKQVPRKTAKRLNVCVLMGISVALLAGYLLRLGTEQELLVGLPTSILVSMIVGSLQSPF